MCNVASFALKIGNSSTYEDGDIVDAFNTRRVRCVYAQHLCKAHDLREMFLLKTCQFQFVRVSKREVKRIALATMAEDILSDKPNEAGEYIDVPLYVARRLKGQRHCIFGAPGKEVWYGGKCDHSNAAMTAVWAEIETRTPEREADYMLWPFTDAELKQHLVMPVDDFSDAELIEYKNPLREPTGKVSDEGHPLYRIVKKRKHFVDWQADLGLTAKEQTDLQDANKRIDCQHPFGVNRQAFPVLCFEAKLCQTSIGGCRVAVQHCELLQNPTFLSRFAELLMRMGEKNVGIIAVDTLGA